MVVTTALAKRMELNVAIKMTRAIVTLPLQALKSASTGRLELACFTPVQNETEVGAKLLKKQVKRDAWTVDR